MRIEVVTMVSWLIEAPLRLAAVARVLLVALLAATAACAPVPSGRPAVVQSAVDPFLDTLQERTPLRPLASRDRIHCFRCDVGAIGPDNRAAVDEVTHEENRRVGGSNIGPSSHCEKSIVFPHAGTDDRSPAVARDGRDGGGHSSETNRGVGPGTPGLYPQVITTEPEPIVRESIGRGGWADVRKAVLRRITKS